jgi:hypothetical protein
MKNIFRIITLVAILVVPNIALAATGTREDPIPMGTMKITSDGWQIVVLRVIPNATDMIYQPIPGTITCSQPNPGYQYFLARLQVKYIGEGSATFCSSYCLCAVGPSSVGYDWKNVPCMIPDSLPTSEVFTGGVIEGYVGWEIKSTDAAKLEMYDNPLSMFKENKDRLYMALYQT